MKRRILLVDDELAILLTLKAVLEIQGFDVTTASSAREAKMKLRQHQFHMVITDNRMESENAGLEVAAAAKKAPYQPAVALLTAFPVADEEWRDGEADQLLVKPMNTQALLVQLVLSLGIYFSAYAASYSLSNLHPTCYSYVSYMVPIIGCLLPLSWAYAFWRVPEEARLSPQRLAMAASR